MPRQQPPWIGTNPDQVPKRIISTWRITTCPEPPLFAGGIIRQKPPPFIIVQDNIQKRRATSWDYQVLWRWIPRQPNRGGEDKNTTAFDPFHNVLLWLGHHAEIRLTISRQDVAYLSLSSTNTLTVNLQWQPTRTLNLQYIDKLNVDMNAA